MKTKTIWSIFDIRLKTVLIMIMLFSGQYAMAQTVASIHKVKKQETIFGIAKDYGVTIEELRDVNPDMREPDFVLKKGMRLNIPASKNPQAKPAAEVADHAAQKKAAAAQRKMVTIGVMLPLHDINGDGKRMVEYYRGMLLAANELKREGYNITINAWNVAEDTDISETLKDKKAADCNFIFGPLYSTQVRTLADFCMSKNIRMVIPFSITGDDVQTCPQIYQVYQSYSDITATSINEFVKRFADYHTVFIDCNDATSKKGAFTFGLRKILEEKNKKYSITNLTNTPAMFARAFSTEKRNIVILNTGRSPELGQVFTKLDELCTAQPNVKISMFGYNEWFLYTRIYGEKFHKYDTYIPSTYDYNKESKEVQRVEKLFENYYKQPVQMALPRFALTGYDHLMFFMKGNDKWANKFHGLRSQQNYTYIQTPLIFEREGNGGYKNKAFMLVHF